MFRRLLSLSNYMIRLLLFFCISVITLQGCQSKNKASGREVSRAFYHWKTVFSPTQYEWDILHQNKVNELYLRFFDVAWDEAGSKPAPIAQLRIGEPNIFAEEKLQLIPTVFITNECIQKIRPEQCAPLAENIHKLIRGIITANAIDSVQEIQIDCDWTASTKEKYFSLLTALQQLDTVHAYSATIRLYQVKYVAKAGVPPVKKGLLMCYNMGNLKDPSSENSILDPNVLKQYTSGLNSYPLPLDLALPLFDWYVLFRNNEYKGLVQQADVRAINNIVQPSGKNHFVLAKDTTLNNVSFFKGDVLRFENSSFTEIMEAASVIRKKLPARSMRLSLYHLDSITLSKYSPHEMEAIFRSLD